MPKQFIVVFDGRTQFETDALEAAIAFRLGGRRGAVFGRMLNDVEETVAPVLPRKKRTRKNSTKKAKK